MTLRFNERPGGPMESAFDSIHPDLQRLLRDFEMYSAVEDLPDPVVTDLVRDVEAQVRIYVRFWKKLQKSLEPGLRQGMVDPEDDGTWRALTLAEAQESHAVAGLVEGALRERARTKFTWHWVRCAADLRTRHYSKAQLHVVRAWWEARTQGRDTRGRLWEYLIHDTHGPHMHIARRAFDWRQRFFPAPTTS